MTKFIQRTIKSIFKGLGFDIIKLSKSPEYTLIGLKNIPFKTIIDVGANKGQFAKYILNFFPEANIYCFEPLPKAFKILSRLTEKTGEKIKSFNFALGESEGNSEIFHHLDHDSSSSFLETTKLCTNLYPFTQKKAAVPVKIATLDGWMKSVPNDLKPEILIKLDVQGYEDRVIRGGIKTFKNAKGCLLEIFLDKLYEDQATFKDISFLLYSLGYEYVGNLNQEYADDGHVIYIDALFLK
ncbi:MAG: FkbM family methyltransferase [Candidatus Hodarchaeota archaeon]